MRNLLAGFGLLVIVAGGLGWYLGWYKLSFTRSTDGNLEIKTDVDTNKVNSDTTNAFKNISAAVSNQKATQDANTTPTSAPGTTQNSTTQPPITPPAPNVPNTPITPAGGIVPPK